MIAPADRRQQPAAFLKAVKAFARGLMRFGFEFARGVPINDLLIHRQLQDGAQVEEHLLELGFGGTGVDVAVQEGLKFRSRQVRNQTGSERLMRCFSMRWLLDRLVWGPQFGSFSA